MGHGRVGPSRVGAISKKDLVRFLGRGTISIKRKSPRFFEKKDSGFLKIVYYIAVPFIPGVLLNVNYR